MILAPHDFPACDSLVLTFDGFKNDRAPGETFATAYGITDMTLAYAIAQGVMPEGLTTATITADQCETIRHVLFWNAVHASELPPGVNLMVYNDGVLTGVGHATRLLQRVVGFGGNDVDGDIGKATLGRVATFDPARLVDLLATADDAYFASLAKATLYLAGWERREVFMQQHAHLMIGA